MTLDTCPVQHTCAARYKRFSYRTSGAWSYPRSFWKTLLDWRWIDRLFSVICVQRVRLQCFDTVGWAAGRASSLYKLSDEVLVWLSIWSEVQMICIWSSWCHCHPVISCFIKIQNGLTFWFRLIQIILEKRPLNGCVSVLRWMCLLYVALPELSESPACEWLLSDTRQSLPLLRPMLLAISVSAHCRQEQLDRRRRGIAQLPICCARFSRNSFPIWSPVSENCSSISVLFSSNENFRWRK